MKIHTNKIVGETLFSRIISHILHLLPRGINHFYELHSRGALIHYIYVHKAHYFIQHRIIKLIALRRCQKQYARLDSAFDLIAATRPRSIRRARYFDASGAQQISEIFGSLIKINLHNRNPK